MPSRNCCTTPPFVSNWDATPCSSHKKTSASIACTSATWNSMSRFFRKRGEGITPHERARAKPWQAPASLHRRAQPALCRRTIRPSRLAPAALAERSRHRHQLSSRRSAAPAWLFARMKMRGSKTRRIKTMINYHSGEARDHLQRFRTAKFVLSRVDKIVVPSGYLVDVFREFGLSASAVPNIVDLSQFRYRDRTPLRPLLVCTRGFSTYYSVDVVVRAFAEVKKEYPEAQLDLVGNGPLEGDIRKLVADLHLTGVNFTGVASRQEIGNYYEQADIFINASWLDNMPLSVIEAFAAGTPVVTTSPECMPYLVEHERTGLLSPVGDEKALAANVIRLLGDPVLAARLAQNARHESRNYTWDAVREQWLNTYRGLG